MDPLSVRGRCEVLLAVAAVPRRVLGGNSVAYFGCFVPDASRDTPVSARSSRRAIVEGAWPWGSGGRAADPGT
jgi:hypothetical protein